MVWGLVIVIVLALGAWFLLSPGNTPQAPIQNSTTTPAQAPTQNVPKAPSPITGGNTYKSLLTQQGNYECDYDQVTASGQNHNVIYISDGKLRAEFHSNTGANAGSFAVYDGHYLYTWTEGKSTGIRTVVTSLGQLPAAIPRDLTSGQIYGNSTYGVGWKCHSWLVNKSLLVPPLYVKFSG